MLQSVAGTLDTRNLLSQLQMLWLHVFCMQWALYREEVRLTRSAGQACDLLVVALFHAFSGDGDRLG